MPNLFTVCPGVSVSAAAATHILAQLQGDARGRAVVFVPTRRAAVSMRLALSEALGTETSLLPRILPLADIDDGMLTLLGADAIALLEQIPPAMPVWQQQYVLAAQVRAFLQQRHEYVGVEYPLALAEDLIALEEQCARAGVRLTPEMLRQLVTGTMATHWEQSLAFLNILAEQWPLLEQQLGMTTSTRREVLVLHALAGAWETTPPDYAVFAVGSTASQDSTAALLRVIAELPTGGVILPGVHPAIPAQDWAAIETGHPLFHVKHFLDRFPVAPAELAVLGETKHSVWEQALAPTASMAAWRDTAPENYSHLHLIPCSHAESEARVISLLMREALENPNTRTALITPDVGLMQRVAAHMRRYGVTIDRMDQGTLAQTEHGSLWVELLAAMVEPERLLHLRSLLHHPLVEVDSSLLAQMEPYWYGVRLRRAGELPKLPENIRMHAEYPALENLTRGLAKLSAASLLPSQWVAQCARLLAPFETADGGADEAVTEILETLGDADLFGDVAAEEFSRLLHHRLRDAKRHGGVATHPQLFMLTPVEARLEQFDRVILGSMTETLWPGMPAPNAWLNLASQAAIGLPPPTHQVSLMAHDVLMLGSAAEVFLTWPLRDQGSPTQRSRFIERLVALLAMHGVKEDAVTAGDYLHWSEQLFAADVFAPSPAPEPRPTVQQRPEKLPVSALDALFGDPFSVYARHVLRLKTLDDIDADAEASDFGSLAHKAIQALTEHWNQTDTRANEQEIGAIADTALREFSNRASTALFWRSRLVRALGFVNETEEERRQSPTVKVESELPLEKTIALSAEAGLVLHGRLDRLEHSKQGPVIADYKTGEIPNVKKITEGYATQLLAYALLVTDVAALEYWRLPHAKHEGAITRVDYNALVESGVIEKLKDGLRQMLDIATPFLATPDRIRDYDGISRYDEWAS